MKKKLVLKTIKVKSLGESQNAHIVGGTIGGCDTMGCTETIAGCGYTNPDCYGLLSAECETYGDCGGYYATEECVVQTADAASCEDDNTLMTCNETFACFDTENCAETDYCEDQAYV